MQIPLARSSISSPIKCIYLFIGQSGNIGFERIDGVDQAPVVPNNPVVQVGKVGPPLPQTTYQIRLNKRSSTHSASITL